MVDVVADDVVKHFRLADLRRPGFYGGWDFPRQKARPSHPRRDAEAQERFKKGGFATS